MNKKIPSLLSVAAILALTAGCSHSQLNNPSVNDANNHASNYGENQPFGVTDGQSQPIDEANGNASVRTTARNDQNTDTITSTNAAPDQNVAKNGTDGKPVRNSTAPSHGDASLGASSSGRGR